MSIDSLVAVVAAKPTAKPYLTPAMTVQELLTFFSAAILLCLIISLLTLAIVQLFRPYMRGSSQRMMFRRWRDAWEFEHISRAGPETFPIPPSLRPLIEEFDEFAAFGADDEDIEPEERAAGRFHLFNEINEHLLRTAWRKMSEEDERVIGRMARPSLWSALPHGLLMKQLQDGAALILARPSLHVSEYLALARGASDLDRATVLYLDYFSQRNPFRVAAIKDETFLEHGIRQSIASAQQAVGAAADKTLDAMQLRLEASLASQSRLASILVGGWIAAVGLLCIASGHWQVAVPLGLVGGLLSSMIYEASASLLERRRS